MFQELHGAMAASLSTSALVIVGLAGLPPELVIIREGHPCAMCDRPTLTYSLVSKDADPAREVVAGFLEGPRPGRR